MGAYTYDVCTGKEKGVTQKADAVRKLSKGGCVTMQTRERGSRNPKLLQASYVPPKALKTDIYRVTHQVVPYVLLA